MFGTDADTSPDAVVSRRGDSAATSLLAAELAPLKQSSPRQDDAAELPGLAKASVEVPTSRLDASKSSRAWVARGGAAP